METMEGGMEGARVLTPRKRRSVDDSTCSMVVKTPETKARREWAAEVTAYMFVGNRRHANDLKRLLEENVACICNVADDVKNFFPGKFEYQNLNVKDFGKDKGISRVFAQAASFVDKARSKKMRVLIHCYAGQNRSVTVCIAMLMILEKLSLKAAYQLVLKKVRDACPFRDNRKELLAFEAKLYGSNSMSESDFITKKRRKVQRRNSRLTPTSFSSSPIINRKGGLAVQLQSLRCMKGPRDPHGFISSFSSRR